MLFSDYHTVPRHPITMHSSQAVRLGTPLPPIREDSSSGAFHLDAFVLAHHILSTVLLFDVLAVPRGDQPQRWPLCRRQSLDPGCGRPALATPPVICVSHPRRPGGLAQLFSSPCHIYLQLSVSLLPALGTHY